MLTVGDYLPDFEIPNQNNDIVHFSDYKGQRLVLFAFPLAGTRRCTVQACTYRDSYSEFAKLDTKILGITGNPVGVIRKWHKHHRFPFDLLSDNRNELLDELGAWGDPVIAGIELPLAKRSYWVIDEQGMIQESAIEVDFEDSVYDSLEFVKRQFA